MLSRSHPIILFIDRFGFSVYQDTLTNIPKFNFTPDLISNLDVVNKEQFVNLVSTFIQINKIVGSSLAIILSDNVIYIKDLANPVQKPAPAQDLKADSDGKEQKDETQSFLENIPFEEVLAKTLKTGNVNRVVAVNKDLIMTIGDAFASKGSILEAIAPSFMFGQNANFTQGLTATTVHIILENAEILKLGNLLTDQEKIISSQNMKSDLTIPSSDTRQDLANGEKKPQNRRQFILIGVFAILLIVLTIVYFTFGVSQTPPKSSKLTKTPTSTAIIPTAVPTVSNLLPTLTQTLVATAPADLKAIKVTIVQSAQMDEKAAIIKNELLKMGLTDIVNQVPGTSVPEKSSIVFSPSIPTGLRNNIIVEIKKILPDISILESQDLNSTNNIIIRKSYSKIPLDMNFSV